jgi:hypothetical protein
LTRYRYLRSTYLHAFVGGASVTRFKERLGDLFHEGFLDRPAQQWQFAKARCQPAVYEIGERARRTLDQLGWCENESRTFFGPRAHRQFLHSVMICDALASIELAAGRQTSTRFIPWSEIIARVLTTTHSAERLYGFPIGGGLIVPDGLFGIEYSSNGRSAFRFFALEFDRETMPIVRTDKAQSSFGAKLETYDRLISDRIHKTHLGIPNLVVLALTVTEQHLVRIMRVSAASIVNKSAFLFKSAASKDGVMDMTRPNSVLFNDPWLRVDHPALAMGTL